MWPRHLRVLFALNINFWAFRFETKLEFLCLLCSSLWGFWSRALKIIRGYSDRSSVFKLTLKFGSLVCIQVNISEVLVRMLKMLLMSLEPCWSLEHVVPPLSTHCCHSCPVLSGPSATSKFLHWNMNWWNFGNWEVWLKSLWLMTWDGFDFCVVSMLTLTRSPMRTGTVWSNRLSVSQCFTFTNGWQSSS